MNPAGRRDVTTIRVTGKGAQSLMRHGLMLGLVPFLVLSLAGPQVGLAQPAIQVYVDGQVVNFDVPATVIDGRVLVPLRGVFERLGATVDYDASTQHIVALRGNQAVELTIGSRQARVNNLPALLDVPAFTIAGRTMVPLRFVSESLGAGVQWVDASRTILITSAAAAFPVPPPSPPPAPAPSYVPPAPAPPPSYVPPPPTQVPPITGQLVSVVTGTTPFIVVAAGGQQYKLPVAPSATVARYNAETRAGGPVGLAALQPGDTVTVTANSLYEATRIVASYRVAAQAPPPAPARPFAVEIVAGKIVDANLQARTAGLDNGRTVTVLNDTYIAHDGGPAGFGAIAAGRIGRFWVLGGTNQAVAVDVTERMEVRPVEGTIVDANFKARTARLAGGRVLTAATNIHVTRNGGPTDFGAVAAGRLGRFWVIDGTNEAVAIDLADAAAGPGSLPSAGMIEGWIVDVNFRARTARLANGQTVTVFGDAYVARDNGPTDFGAVAAGRYGRFWVTAGTTQAFLVDLSEPIAVQVLTGKIVDANFRARTVRLANGQTFTVPNNVYIARNGGRTDFGAVAAGRSGTFWVIQGTNQVFLVDLRDQ
jgi:copper amine oxidase-like protein